MKLEKVSLHNFRNYESAIFEPSEGLNVLVGKNAQGKTNLLEAVFLCCSGRSHRTSHDMEMIRENAEEARVDCVALRRDGSHDVSLTLSRRSKKKVSVNGSGIARLGELMGHVTSVLFSPEDLLLIKQGPGERRRFMDIAISQMHPSYFYALQQYNRTLLQRNRLLKTAKRPLDLLDVFDEQLVKAARVIIKNRAAFIHDLSEVAMSTHFYISSQSEELSMQYAASKATDELLFALKGTRERDLRMGSTSYGPHKDDLVLKINGRETRSYASQGQQRTAALSLKIAQLRLMEQSLDEAPLLMLDDVLSELDEARREMLFSSVGGVQILITCTDATRFPEGGRVFRVQNGSLTAEES